MNTSPSPAIARPLQAAPAALPYRLLSPLYDVLPVAALWFIVAALGLLLRSGVPVTPNTPAAYLEFAAMLLVTFAYLGISWRRGGQTLGMRAWRLRLVNADGSATIEWHRLAVRYVVAGVSLACFGLGFLWSLVDRDRRSWHDMASGTVLLRLPKNRS